MKSHFICCFLLVGALSYAQAEVEIRDGDLLFESLDCGDLCAAINRVTKSYKGKGFNHMGMAYKEGDSLFVIEASSEGVTRSSFTAFKRKTDRPIYVARLKKRYRKYIPASIRFALRQVGTLYDDEYTYNNGKYYCSELIYDAFLYAKSAPLFKLLPMTFKDPRAGKYFDVWEKYFEKLHMPIPEGELGCNPGAFSLSNKIKMISIIH